MVAIGGGASAETAGCVADAAFEAERARLVFAGGLDLANVPQSLARL
jgi:hypothetical protein